MINVNPTQTLTAEELAQLPEHFTNKDIDRLVSLRAIYSSNRFDALSPTPEEEAEERVIERRGRIRDLIYPLMEAASDAKQNQDSSKCTKSSQRKFSRRKWSFPDRKRDLSQPWRASATRAQLVWRAKNSTK